MGKLTRWGISSVTRNGVYKVYGTVVALIAVICSNCSVTSIHLHTQDSGGGIRYAGVDFTLFFSLLSNVMPMQHWSYLITGG